MIGLLVFLAATGALLWVRTRTHLAYFQQEDYDSARYLRALVGVRLFDVKASAALLVAAALGAALERAALAPWLAAAALLAIAAAEARYPFKKALVLTERARRILWLTRAAMALLLLLAPLHLLLALAVLQAVPFVMMAANAVLAPMQEKINAGFVAEAEAKRAEIDPVTIGITGSFGKTTVKHMLAEMLAVDGPVFYSRGSINTVLGLTRHIRQRLQPGHRYFIAEMGAYGIGSIRRLCEFARPDYGIVTAVGHAHAERFGSLAATAQAKSELAAAICADGQAVVMPERVAALAPFAALRAAHPGKVVVVGEGEGADVRILGHHLEGADRAVRLRLASGAEQAYLLPLLGEHNVMNLALVVALIERVAPAALERLPRIAPGLSQVPHRLQKKETARGPLILDDAYNSNEEGFANALRVTREVAQARGGRAVLVTPGMAELGAEHARAHAAIGALARDLCDVVIAVNPERIRDFTAAAAGGRAELREAPNLRAAQAMVAAMDLGPADVVLYENDLPDVLEEKRLL